MARDQSIDVKSGGVVRNAALKIAVNCSSQRESFSIMTHHDLLLGAHLTSLASAHQVFDSPRFFFSSDLIEGTEREREARSSMNIKI